MAVLDAARPRDLRLARRVSVWTIFVGVFPILMSLLMTQAVAQVTEIAPGPPRDFKATPSNRKITLTWKPPSYTGSHGISRYRALLGNTGVTPSSGAAARSHTFSNINNGQTYDVKVEVIGDGDMGKSSLSETLTVTPRIPAPTNLKATAGDGQVTLSWTAPSGLAAALTGYQYSQDGGSWESIGSLTSTSGIIPGLTNGISYIFKVRAVRTGASDDSDGTATRTVTVRPLGEAPGAPRTLNVERVEDTAILTWSPPSNAGEDPIRYEYSSDGGSTWKSTGSSSTRYTVPGLEAGETYTFFIRGVYLDGGTSRIISFHSTYSNSAVLNYPKPKRRIIYECPVGWTRGSVFGKTKKALIYELKVNVDHTNRVSIYELASLAIYVHPDEGLETLDGWYLTTSTLYNHNPGNKFHLTAENSVIDELGFAHIKNLDATPSRLGTLGFIGQSLPSFDYRLYDERGIRVDFGISCYKEGGLTYRLWNTKDPRVVRMLPLVENEAGLKGMLKDLNWDAFFIARNGQRR